jgi:multimeric flavodoxin WrbA
MKALGIVGSPRKNGNTEILTAHTLRAIAEEGLETELLRLAGLDIRPCDECLVCRQGKPCPIKDDVVPIYAKMREADAIIVATPVFFSSAAALTRALLERVGYMGYDEKPFTGKVGGPLVVARRAGQNFTFAELLLWFHIMGMVMPGSTYWNVAFGRNKGDVSSDEEGLETAWNFGKNVARVTRKLRG